MCENTTEMEKEQKGVETAVSKAAYTQLRIIHVSTSQGKVLNTGHLVVLRRVLIQHWGLLSLRLKSVMNPPNKAVEESLKSHCFE